jgi:hypothetical protein
MEAVKRRPEKHQMLLSVDAQSIYRRDGPQVRQGRKTGQRRQCCDSARTRRLRLGNRHLWPALEDSFQLPRRPRKGCFKRISIVLNTQLIFDSRSSREMESSRISCCVVSSVGSGTGTTPEVVLRIWAASSADSAHLVRCAAPCAR